MLASEGRPFSDAVIARVVELAKAGGASVRVFTIARIHGVSFGMQMPGLLPTKAEWEEQRDIVDKAVKRLERKGIEADGHVVGTRKSTKRIVDEAKIAGCDAIVMGADPDRNRVLGDVSWSQEPQRVRRKAKIRVPGPTSRLRRRPTNGQAGAIRARRRPCSRASLIASSSDSRSSSSSSSPVSSSIRPSRWRSVFGWMYSSRADSITLRRSARYRSSVSSSAVRRLS